MIKTPDVSQQFRIYGSGAKVFQREQPEKSLFKPVNFSAIDLSSPSQGIQNYELSSLDILSWGKIEWETDEDGALHPVADYHDNLNRGSFPEDVYAEYKETKALPDLFLKLENGDVLITTGQPENVKQLLEAREQEAIRAFARSERYRNETERFVSSFSPVDITIANPFLGQPETEDLTNSVSCTFENSRDIVLLSDIKWEQDPETDRFSPQNNYTDKFHSGVTFNAENESDLPKTAIKLDNGRLYFSHESRDDLAAKIELAEDKASDAIRDRGWSYNFRRPVFLPVTQYDKMGSVTDTTILDSMAFGRVDELDELTADKETPLIRKMEWTEVEDGLFKPAQYYTKTLNTDTAPVHPPKINGEYALPGVFLQTMDQEHSFMVYADIPFIKQHIHEAQQSAIETNQASEAELRSRDGYLKKLAPQPQETKPDHKPLVM